VRVGNARYRLAKDLPSAIPVFPLAGALLLPGGRMPLNVFEPRYLQMIDEVMGGSRLIGMIQPSLDGALRADGEPELCSVGCAGRIISLAETGDGRYLISLQGVCRFRIGQELTVKTPFRQCRMAPYGPAEIQALLEAPDLKTRAVTLIAITEMTLARESEDFGPSLQ
jgi:Lon protease-like protein